MLSGENSINTENDARTITRNKFGFEEINPDNAENIENLSKITKKTTDEQNGYSSLSSKSSNHSLDLSEDDIFTLIKTMKDKLELDYVVLSETIKMMIEQ